MKFSDARLVIRPIDVLAFPPDTNVLDQMRRVRIERCHEIERRARLALFVGVTLFLTWVADVAAVFEHPTGVMPAAFGVASLALAVAIAVAHWSGRWLLRRARRLRQQTEHGFAEVRVHQAHGLVALAAVDGVVAQYLRMVGRQRRALRCLELAALSEWVLAHRGNQAQASDLGRSTEPLGRPPVASAAAGVNPQSLQSMQSGRERLLKSDEEIPRPELATVGMAG